MKKIISALYVISTCCLSGCQIGATAVDSNTPDTRFNLATGITSLYPFAGGSGLFVETPLMQANDGNLYGTSTSGGGYGSGTIFKISLTGTKTLIYNFGQNQTDAAYPRAGLIQLSDNYLYGTSSAGGNPNACESNGCGAIYKISLTGQNEQIIYAFESRSTGNTPLGGVTYNDHDGFLYGTASAGGINCAESGSQIGCGIVFKIKPDGSDYAVVHQFAGGNNDGQQPEGNLIVATNGVLYGITSNGGTNNVGTIYKIESNGNEAIVYSFESGSDGAYPGAGLIQASDGNLYGTTNYGGYANQGVVYKFDLNNQQETVIKTFMGGNDGANPNCTLVQANNGLLYGTTIQGGAAATGTHNSGTIFAIALDGTYYQVLALFNQINGSFPYAGLVQASNNLFYGTSSQGSTYFEGNVFVFNPTNN
ncbi:MAG: hypothetical protein ORN24_00075 [Burkholderiales bacterium]|nr:hypothetical protein [Burkholderiales bacterium]